MLCESWTAAALPESVPRLRSRAVDYAATCDVLDSPIGDLKLALSEAITNAVLHAFRERDPGTVTVTLSVDAANREVKAIVVDDGVGCLPRPDSPGLGLGLPLIATVAETMEVCTAPSGHGTEVA